MRFQLSLKQSWTSIAVLSVVIPTVILGGWYGTTIFNQRLSEALTVEHHANKVRQLKIDSELRHYKTLLENKSDPLLFLMESIDDSGSLKKIGDLLAYVNDREVAIHELMILSPQGQVFAVADAGMGITGDRLLRPEELQAVAVRAGFNNRDDIPEVIIPLLGRTYVGSPKKHDDIVAFSIAMPIGSPAKAILVVLIDVEKLWRSMREDSNATASAHKTQSYILDRRGALLTDLDGEEYVSGDLMTHMAITRAALIGENWPTDASYIGVQGKPVYGTLTTVPSLNWSLISEVATAEIIQPIVGSIIEMFLVVLLGMIFIILVVLRLVGKTIIPIQQASDAIENVATGSFEFELHPSGIRELDVMNRGIVDMAVARQKAEKTLIEKEEEQREILASMMDGVITIDESGVVLSFNRSAELLFGYSADEVIGNNVKMLMTESNANQHDHYLQRYHDTGEVHILGMESGREVEGLRKNKEVFSMRLLVTELPKGEDDRLRFIGSCYDLTVTKQQEEQLRRGQKMNALGTLTGGIAHDYNNMLAVILGYSGLLKQKLIDQPNLADYVDKIEHAGQRGADLTKKLLSFSGKELHNAIKIDINDLLSEQQDMLQKTLTVAVELNLELESGIWPIYLDCGDLEDAILNMSINAMHAMAENDASAQLTIRTRNQPLELFDAQLFGVEPRDYVQLSFIDTGIGIEDAIKSKIFDPFFTTKQEKGTGLGLSQVYGLVDRAGGTIKVYSEPGNGCEFTLYFPRYHDDGEVLDSQEGSEPTVASGDGEVILIVDDEAALRELASELLVAQGYKVICAENAAEALKILESESIDLMLSDIIMPGMNGYQLASIVREKYPDMKIQLVSGFSDESPEEIGDDLNHKLLRKPYKSKELFERIRSLLDEGCVSK